MPDMNEEGKKKAKGLKFMGVNLNMQQAENNDEQLDHLKELVDALPTNMNKKASSMWSSIKDFKD
jgi:hypothetical protein